MYGQKIVVIGASTGGVEPLKGILSGIPPSFPGSIFVVLQGAATASPLPDVLSKAANLPARYPHSGQKIEPGVVYVAPPDRNILLLRRGEIELCSGPPENDPRPAIDPLFRTAALTYGPAVTGVILSGAMHDGILGSRKLSAVAALR